MEFNAVGARFETDNEYFKIDLNTLILQENLAIRFRAGNNKKVWVQLKAGGGMGFINETLDYSDNTENNRQDKTLNYGYFTAGGGLSVFIIPSTMFMMEIGADFYNLFIPDKNIGILNPYVGIGIRF